uniref:Large ribosomal subunit protein bL19m n=1 Tax=Petromyzon marinus TaxID=7757 RepID=A0AAJ7UDJ3_PETMA|nr:39S ribosomal protein L19, mitochondrial [Petromyzon marinus]
MAALVLHAARRGSLRAFTTASGCVRAAAAAVGGPPVDGDVGGGGPPVDGDVGGGPATAAGPGGFQAPRRPVLVDPEQSRDAQETRLSPEFIRPPSRTNPLLFHLQRRDMERRRRVLAIPDFYPGSVLAVTLSDVLSPGRVRRFVGICLKRSGSGLGATATLRNVIEGQGVELVVELYNPRVHLIEVLRLEQRLDDDLSYLRDALPSYSCFPDSGGGGAAPTPTPSGNAVPVNTTVVEMLPRPWSRRWGSELRGASLPAPPHRPPRARRW